jgi:hypothetical protein
LRAQCLFHSNLQPVLIKPEFRFAYFKTKDDVESDLVVERPGLPLLCIEIKSTENLRETDLTSFSRLIKDIPNCEALCFSRVPIPKKYDLIQALPWAIGIKRYFTH